MYTFVILYHITVYKDDLLLLQDRKNLLHQLDKQLMHNASPSLP